MMYSVLSITTRATPLSAITMMWSLSFLRFSSAKCYDLVMFVCIGLLVKVLRILLISGYRPVQSTPLSSPVWRAATVVVEMYSLMGMVAGVTANFGPFCSKVFSFSVSSFLQRLITHMSWILEEVKEVTAVLKVLVVPSSLGLSTQKAINTLHFLDLHLQWKCHPYVHTFQTSRQLNL